ncbi:IclR family transcriptional regulator [Halopolyspora algeriensis]|uniref:IclR family transcriptional regulator n=1 Tax=Halopolyspora algeriensis TaxID=1500506 RepID=A0A368VEP5_9ACTN|nr:IclR family transcriptional regulator [Halopolyspora algeriensis]RCW39628.1 IclR family transcriptional regulator [Halopolyspora algeriensis]TQM54078.1 IclR family transcriptional regulator [Halopolyspora algeriensis]
MPGQIREPGRTVTSRVLAVLDAFGPDDTDLSLAELCRRTGLAPATAHRLAGELVAWGGLERSGDHHYRIGLRLFEIGMRAPGRYGLSNIALPFLEDLYEVTRENVHLAVRDGHHAVYLHKITGRRAVGAPSRSGGRLPLHATGMGKALLAFSDYELAEETIAAGLSRYTSHTITSPGLLRRALVQIRRRGFSVAAQEYSLGTVSVAAPVLSADGQALAAISVVVRSSRANVARLGPAVRTAAMGISRQLSSTSAASRERVG